MAIHQKLQTRLSQKLVLTPSLQQAIKLLPMSTVELADHLTQELVENPVLEEIPDEGTPPEPAEQDGKTAADQPATPDAEPADRGDGWDDADYEYFFGDYLEDGYRPGPRPSSRSARRSRTRCRPARRCRTICCDSSVSRRTRIGCGRSVRPSSGT